MKVKDMTVDDLRSMISEAVEQTLSEMLKDPDWGLALRDDVEQRLRDSVAASERGERGIPIEEVTRTLGIDSA